MSSSKKQLQPKLNRRLGLIVLCVLAQAWGGCVTGLTKVRSGEQLEYLKSVLAATRLSECSVKSSRWEVPARLRHARVVKSGGKLVFLYEGIFRTGIRTVWQPLNSNLSFNGDGIILGQKDQTYVIDFNVVSDAAQNTWTAYRAKIADSELYTGTIEFLEKNSKKPLVRIKIPTSDNESIQQIWTLTTSTHGMINVVVRTNSFADEATEGTEQSLFAWYQVYAPKKQARKMAEYQVAGENLTGAEFIPLAGSGEPVAVAIASRAQDDQATDPKLQRQTSKIVLKRIFSAAKDEIKIYDSRATISSLEVATRQPTDGSANLLIGWIQDGSGNSTATLQWGALKFDLTESGFAAAATRRAEVELPAQPDSSDNPLFTLFDDDAESEDTLLSLENSATSSRFFSAMTAQANKKKKKKPAAKKQLQLAPKSVPNPFLNKGMMPQNSLYPIKSLELSHDPLQLKFRQLPGQNVWALTWWSVPDNDFAYMGLSVLPPAPEEERITGRGENSTPRKLLVPATAGVYSPNGVGKMVGMFEASAQGESDLILISTTNEANPNSPTVLNLCGFDSKF